MSYAVIDTRIRHRSSPTSSAPLNQPAVPACRTRQCSSHACSRQDRQQQPLQQ